MKLSSIVLLLFASFAMFGQEDMRGMASCPNIAKLANKSSTIEDSFI